MKMKTIYTILFASILLSCNKVPITGRKQTTWASEAELMKMSDTEYRKFLSENKVVNNTLQSELVKKVGVNISTSIKEFFKTYQNGKYNQLISTFNWEFNTIEDKNVNAWCMPGGKVAFYTGIFPITKDEQGLAVVMGHEIAHAVAKHGNERMTQQMKAQGLGKVIGVAVSGSPQATQDIFSVAFGISGNLALLKYSRNHESEADKLGLVFMALAGYDPSAAIPFWERMAALSSEKPPQFLSTHPSDAQRVKDLQAWLPEAMKYYKKAN
jgi:predicted Zn-dependent protease